MLVRKMFMRLQKNVKKTGKYLFSLWLFWTLLMMFTFHKTAAAQIFFISAELFIFYGIIPYAICILLEETPSKRTFFVYGIVYLTITLFLSYYLGILGVHVKYHTLLVPVLIIGGALVKRAMEKKEQTFPKTI